mgnify:CR=1 FL=1
MPWPTSAQKIALNAPIAQTISRTLTAAQLVINGPLKKGMLVADGDGRRQPDRAGSDALAPKD